MRTEIINNEIENGHKQASIKPKTWFSEKTDKADKSLSKLIYVKIVTKIGTNEPSWWSQVATPTMSPNLQNATYFSY